MFKQLLERLAFALDAAAFPYMIIGGQAVLLYGEPRLTRDVDLTLGADLDRLGDLVTLAASLGLRPLVNPEEFTRRTLVLPCEDPATRVRVDFILSFSPYERQAIERARAVAMGQAQVRFAAPEDLIVHKLIAGRPRDLEDVRGVLLKTPDVDLAYVRRWLREFEEALGRPLLERFEQLRPGY